MTYERKILWIGILALAGILLFAAAALWEVIA
jgi:hypothetical protein